MEVVRAPRAKLSSNKLDTLALWNAERPGKTSFSVFARKFNSVANSPVDLAIGAALLTSNDLVFGPLIGDR